MPTETTITLTQDVGGQTFIVRANVSRQIDNEFVKMTTELKKKADNPDLESNVTQNSLIDFFIERMSIKPKLTKELIADMDTREVEALYYAIVEKTEYENGDFIGMFDTLDIDLDQLDDKKLMQRKAIEYQKLRVANIKKKHLVQ